MFGPNAAESLGAVLCGAVQLELFLAQQQTTTSPAQAMAAAQERVRRRPCQHKAGNVGHCLAARVATAQPSAAVVCSAYCSPACAISESAQHCWKLGLPT
jgi:hypothetical protein